MESYIDKVQVARLENGFIPNEEKGEEAVGGRFFIPKYQRGYRWTTLQVEQLMILFTVTAELKRIIQNIQKALESLNGLIKGDLRQRIP